MKALNSPRDVCPLRIDSQVRVWAFFISLSLSPEKRSFVNIMWDASTHPG